MAKSPMMYFSSDWHFKHDTSWINSSGEQKHRGVVTFERDCFSSVEEHDAYLVDMITNWSKKWAPGSTFWFLGDFGSIHYLWVFDVLRIKEITVNCILGNHDKVENIPQFREHCDNVYEYPVYLSQKLVISHYPVAVYEDSINIHGHLHGSKLQDMNHINASVHVANYAPISEKQISSIFTKLPKFNRRFLYEPFAADYIFTQPKEDVVMDKSGRIDLSASRLYMKLKTENNTSYKPYTGGL